MSQESPRSRGPGMPRPSGSLFRVRLPCLLRGEKLNLDILGQRKGTRASQSWACSLVALPVTVESGQDRRRDWQQGSPKPQITHEAGVSGTSPAQTLRPQFQPETGEQEGEILSPAHPRARVGCTHTSHQQAAWWPPRWIVSDFGAPPPLADLAALCKILKAALARDLTRKLSQ